MQEIPLTHGYVALVDDEDYERLRGYRWHAQSRRRLFYAFRYLSKHERPRAVAMHREVVGAGAGTQVDHANGNGLDNRRENLRFCNHAQNQANRHSQVPHSSRFRGVSRDRKTGLWHPCLKVDQHTQHLGYYADEVTAARVYDAVALEIFGEFAYLNRHAFPELFEGVR